MKRILSLFFVLIFTMTLSVEDGYAQKKRSKKPKTPKQDFIVPCGHPVWRALDFWVGEWQVFHKDTGKIAGYDRVIRTLKGCVIQQNWISLDDHFSSPYVPFRMAGKSLTSFTGQEWVQFWADNQGGTVILRGKFENKIFTLVSENLIEGFRYRLRYFKEKNGTVRVINDRKFEGKTSSTPQAFDSKINLKNVHQLKDWVNIFDFIYKRNNNELLLPQDLKTPKNYK
jgi:hypothetical protein